MRAKYQMLTRELLERAKSLMKRAGVDLETIAIVLKKMAEADGKH